MNKRCRQILEGINSVYTQHWWVSQLFLIHGHFPMALFMKVPLELKKTDSASEAELTLVWRLLTHTKPSLNFRTARITKSQAQKNPGATARHQALRSCSKIRRDTTPSPLHLKLVPAFKPFAVITQGPCQTSNFIAGDNPEKERAYDKHHISSPSPRGFKEQIEPFSENCR